MTWLPRIRTDNGKQQIFCDWRHKFVRLTPEEKVRQLFLHMLVEEYSYPQSLIAVEHPIKVADVQKRCDAVVFTGKLQPVAIIEFKAETIPITQKVFDQIAVYNRKLGVPFLFISNGKTTHVCRLNNDEPQFLTTIPQYKELK